MRKLQRLVIILVLAWASMSMAQDSAKPFDMLQESVVKMIDWFGTLMGSVSSLAAAEDRRRLIDDLSRLSKAVYDLESDKRFLLNELERREISVAAVQQAIDDSEKSLKEVRERLRVSGLSLRQQFRKGGQEVEESLTLVTGSRKLWLEDLRHALMQEPRPDLGPTIARGKELVQALSTAHQQLVQLIDALQQQA